MTFSEAAFCNGFFVFRCPAEQEAGPRTPSDTPPDAPHSGLPRGHPAIRRDDLPDVLRSRSQG